MNRSKVHPQTLKHLPFFELLASAPEGSPEAKLATAGLLSLRMIDHWVLAGPAIVEPESVSVRSVRQAIMALPSKEPVREALLTIVNTMQMLRQVDLVPVLPRVFAYGQLLERHHGSTAMASDAYASVIRLADLEYDAALVMDAYYQAAACQRKTGDLAAAEESSSALVKLATRRKDRPRVLRGRMGLGHAAMMRGDLASADSIFASVATDAQQHDLAVECAMATHNRGVVAFRSGRPADAVVLSHRALKYATNPVDRDRVLSDLAAFLINLEQYDAAVDALRILDVTATSVEPRQAAKVNLLIVAVRIGNRAMFDSAREELLGDLLTIEARVNLLIETARGYFAFGEPTSARSALAAAVKTARDHGLERAADTAESLLRAEPALGTGKPSVRITQVHSAEVADDLRQMAAALMVQDRY